MMNPEKPEQPSSLPQLTAGAGAGFRFRLYLASLRPHKLRYMLVFCLGPMLFSRQDRFFDVGLRFSGLDAAALLRLSFFLGAGFLFLFAASSGIRLYARRLSISIAALFLAWLLLPAGLIALLAAVCFAFGLGGCAALAAYAYTRALNDAERLLGAVITSAFYVLARTITALWPQPPHVEMIRLAAAAAVTLVCLNLYRDEDFAQAPRANAGRHKSTLPLMLFFLAAYRVIGLLGASPPFSSGQTALLPGGLAGLAACMLSLVLCLALKRGVWYLCSLYFAAMTASHAAYLLPDIPGGLALAGALSGFGQMGFIACLYIFGIVMSLRETVRDWRGLWLIMAGFLFASEAVSCFPAASLPPAGLVASGLITFLLFCMYTLLLSSCAPPLDDPAQAQTQASGLAHDRRKALKIAFLKARGLTLREQQITLLLLDGCTARQCAAELGIAEDTVKYHLKHLYRKLHISGRSELFSLLDLIADEPGLPDPKTQG